MSERQRLQRLQEYNILDTPPEEEFDAITRLAARICDTPVAMINFIDENRQWTKSAVGVEVDEVIRENSFCNHTIQQDHEMIIEDMSKDDDFDDHPFVNNPPNFRFYAGINIESPDNHNLGTLCVLDKKKRQISEEQKENLRYLADEISTRLELRRKRRQLKQQNAALKDQSRFLENSTDLMFQLDPETAVIIEAHNGNKETIGFSNDELTNKSLFDVFEEIGPEETLRRWMKDAENSDSFQQEAMLKTKRGKKIWCKINATKEKKCIYLTARDISEKHKTRKKLVAESEMNAKLIHNLPGIFCLINGEGTIINWNKHFLKRGDYSEDALEQNGHYKNYFHFSNEKDGIEDIINTIFEQGEVKAECNLKTGSGDSVPILMNGFRIDYAGEKEAVVIAIDQSEQKEIASELADQKLRFELATNVASDVIWDRDFDENNIWWSEGLEGKFGYERNGSERGVEWWRSKVHPDDREDVIAGLDQFLESDKRYWSGTYRFKKADEHYAHVRETAYVIRDKQQNPKRLIGAIVDETKRVEAQKELKSALNRLNKAHEIAKLGYFEWDPQKDILEWSDLVRQIYGIADQSGPFEMADFKELVHPDDSDKIQQMIDQITKGEDVDNLVHRLVTPAGETKYIEQRVNVDTNEEGEVERITGTAQDVTEKVEQRKQLERFSKVVTETSNLVVITDAEGKAEWVNESFEDVTGYTLKEVKGKKPGNLLQGPDTDPETVKKLSEKIAQGEPVNVEILNYSKSGDSYWLELSIDPVFNQKGEIEEFFAIQKNITERKQYEEDLKRSLNENQVLLSEIHHRVKNNMAIISGLLELEAMQTTNDELSTKIHESQMRIQSMAMVHEKLYQSDDFSNLSFAEYMVQLIESIKMTYGLEERGIALEADIESIEMNINQAISCGLLLHELLTNIVKYGFESEKNQSGEIEVHTATKGTQVVISIRDNGNGVPKDFSFAEQDSLGATLIETLVKQLDANIEITSQEVTEFKVTFDLNKELQGSAANADLSSSVN